MNWKVIARKAWTVLVIVTLPITLPVVAVAAGAWIALLCLVVAPAMILTAPIWLPIKIYFTEVWHAKERRDKALTKLAVDTLLERNQDRTKRQRL